VKKNSRGVACLTDSTLAIVSYSEYDPHARKEKDGDPEYDL
jgi:hypothetical protein